MFEGSRKSPLPSFFIVKIYFELFHLHIIIFTIKSDIIKKKIKFIYRRCKMAIVDKIFNEIKLMVARLLLGKNTVNMKKRFSV